MFLFDHCVTNTIIGLLAANAALATVVAAIVAVVAAPMSIVVVVAAALLSLGAVILGLYDNGAPIYVIDKTRNRIGGQPNS